MPDVIVIGAGAFGGWTAFYLRQMGAAVTLVDAYGPGNVRATSRCLKLVGVDSESGVMWVEGSIPGPEGSLVVVRKAKTRS